jgi:hypothetical protein
MKRDPRSRNNQRSPSSHNHDSNLGLQQPTPSKTNLPPWEKLLRAKRCWTKRSWSGKRPQYRKKNEKIIN